MQQREPEPMARQGDRQAEGEAKHKIRGFGMEEHERRSVVDEPLL